MSTEQYNRLSITGKVNVRKLLSFTLEAYQATYSFPEEENTVIVEFYGIDLLKEIEIYGCLRDFERRFGWKFRARPYGAGVENPGVSGST